MPDTHAPRPSKARDAATVLVTRAGTQDVEVRVWPPEQVDDVAVVLGRLGCSWSEALVDEGGVAGSLLVDHDRTLSDADVHRLVDRLAEAVEPDGALVLGYVGGCEEGFRRAGSAVPAGRDHVVFVDLHETSSPERWAVTAFGVPAALERVLVAASSGRGVGRAAHRGGTATMELRGARSVDVLVGRLDAAGLDGHVRVVRRRRTSSRAVG